MIKLSISPFNLKMAFGRKALIQGIVIGRKDFHELDKIVTLFTSTRGKIKALAKGVRKINSRRLGGLELGSLVKVFLVETKGLDLITEIEIIDSFLEARNDSARSGALIYLSEMTNFLLPEEEKNEEVYAFFLKTREEIKKGRLETIVQFEAKILEILGFGQKKEEQKLIKEKNWRKAHQLIKKRIENIIEKPLKSLAIFR